MKLLFDQNLSSKLPPILNSAFPGSKHVKDFGLTGNDDEAIWQLASEQSFAIVSQNSDFLWKSPTWTFIKGYSSESRKLLHGAIVVKKVKGDMCRVWAKIISGI